MDVQLNFFRCKIINGTVKSGAKKKFRPTDDLVSVLIERVTDPHGNRQVLIDPAHIGF
jgi:hypothetical protein